MKLFTLSFLLFTAVIFKGTVADAQLVGDQIFLQGNWLEVGVAPNGAWGNTMPVPATYHTHTGSAIAGYIDPLTLVAATGNGIDFSYDAGHDGWTVGSPTPTSGTNCCFYGAYFLPGIPFNGWSIQMNGQRSDAYYSSFGYALGTGATFSGTNVGYQYTPGSACGPYMESTAAGTWAGSYSVGGGTISIRSTNRIDTNASWDLVNVTFKNTGATPVTGVYYMVTGDPDNDQVVPPGTFPTNNRLIYQGDALQRREVIGRAPHPDRQDGFSGLATKDCRAKALIYTSWPAPLIAGNSLDLFYAEATTGVGPTWYDVGDATTTDVAYALVFNVGALAPGDSTRISFAWIFNDTTAVDSAFVQPRLNVNCQLVPNTDTFIACGLSSVPVNIVHGEWGCTNWTWAPATGLASTTGITNSVYPALIGAGITYTITSSDVSSCHSFQFTLYIPPCHNASSNSPADSAWTDWICVGDTLNLLDHGDSVGATYTWYGPGVSPIFPGPVRGFTQYVDIFPTTIADTGWYFVVKTVAGMNDTARTHVMLKPLPVISLTYNAPICSGNTLILSSAPDSVGETWAWTGPVGFTSTLSDPTRATAPTAFSGIYTMVATFKGCTDSGTLNVVVDSTPAVPIVGNNSELCENDLLLLTCVTATPGVSYNWTGPAGFTSTLQNPSIPSVPITATGIYNVTVRLGSCTSSGATVVTVNPIPVPVLGSNSPVCTGNSLNLTTTALPGSTFAWTGPMGYTSGMQYPIINPAFTSHGGTYSVVVTLNNCPSTITWITVVVDTTPELPVLSTNSPGPPGVTICQGDTLTFTSFSATAFTSYTWVGPNTFHSTQQNPIILNATPAASGIYTLVASIGSCSTTPTMISATVTPTPPVSITSNSPVCSGSKDTIKLQAAGSPGSTFTWSGPYTFFSNAVAPQRTPVSIEYAGEYYATVLLDGCTNKASHTVVVNPTPPAPWVKWLNYCQYYDAPYLQAFGTDVRWYSSSADGSVGSFAPPKPQTDVVGVTFYFANQTITNCPSAIDSIRVRIDPTPKVTVSPDVKVCPWDSVVLKAVNTDAIAYYNWYPEQYLETSEGPSVIARPETNTEYMVVTSNMYGCTDTATVSVTVWPNAVVHIRDSITLFPGETFQMAPATNCSRFSWTPGVGLSSRVVSNPVASPEISTKYVVTGVTEWGCKTKDSINININTEALLTIPNAFAPGSTNATFKVIRKGIATLRHFRIYDRWGVMVFETKDIDAGWDGTYKGTPQPVGVYVYVVSAVSLTGREFNKTGNVTLLR